MKAAVGTALKKLAAALLGDRETAKKAATAVLVLLVALLFPVIAIASVFSGTLEFDTDALQEDLITSLTDAERAQLQEIEDTAKEIERAMRDASLPAKTADAQVLYLLALYGDAHRPDFVPKLVGCFQEGQSDAELIAAINQTFGTDILAEDFSKIMQSIRGNAIDISQYRDPATKNNLDLVQWALSAEKAGWGYVWGTYGRVLSERLFTTKLEQYPDHVGIYEDFIRANWLGKRTADCIGLIKGYGWFDPDTGEIRYAANGMPDIGAGQMYRAATEKGVISTIPEIPGLAVWHAGHIGIYIGGGEVIEAMGTKYGVVKTKLSARRFTHWLKIPYITYIDEEETS